MKLSIIIPTYNIEKYIKECIYSCYNQQGVSTDDYEIIVVNDGSTDRSVDVVVEAQQEIPNLRIVSRPNGGLSAARNTGLDCAKGEFVWFVDGDDCIEANALSILFKAFQQHDCDAYIINYSTFTQYGVEKKPSFNLPKNEFSSRHLMEAENRLLPMMSWLTICRRSFLQKNNLRFTEGILHEDIDFSVRFFYLSNHIYYINRYLYRYRVDNSTSIMAKAKKDCTKSIVSHSKIIENWQAFFEKDSCVAIKSAFGLVSFFITTSLLIDSYQQTVEIKEILRNRNKYYKYLWDSGNKKYQLLSCLLKLFPNKINRTILRVYYKK